eukprot:TRINITY_DN33_c0_g1_i6.p1 TRINITY_DN33_c0_g1~~TRINITY_DN33_c0_g1_i6.p1  ORF type:complete len:202 (-),score=35.65 TRINITY_DN33_c0_g1_i6:214-819(-)
MDRLSGSPDQGIVGCGCVKCRFGCVRMGGTGTSAPQPVLQDVRMQRVINDQCSTACSPGCQNATCDQQTGHCSPCKPGDACSAAEQAGIKGDMISTPVHIGLILGAGILTGLCVIILGVVVWKLRSRRVPREKTNAKGAEAEALSPLAYTGKATAEFQRDPCQEGPYETVENDYMTSDPTKAYGQLSAHWSNTGDVLLYDA